MNRLLPMGEDLKKRLQNSMQMILTIHKIMQDFECFTISGRLGIIKQLNASRNSLVSSVLAH